jgi:hypothetical protein
VLGVEQREAAVPGLIAGGFGIAGVGCEFSHVAGSKGRSCGRSVTVVFGRVVARDCHGDALAHPG